MTPSADISKHDSLLFRVEGMHCIKCIRKIQSVGSHFKSIKNLDVNLGEHLVIARASDDFPVEAFMDEVKSEGFKIVSLPKNDAESQVKASQKNLLMRIGVAGFCSGNIMLLATADYLEASIEGWPRLFSFLSMVFFMPVLFYAAKPLFESSLSSLKAHKMSIDSPIALALVGGAALSIYNLLVNQGPTYFDSLSMFVFFLMGSRFVVQKIQTRYVSGVSTKDLFNQSRALLVEGSQVKSVRSDLIQVGDKVRVTQNSFIGFDGVLDSSIALIDDAFFTGEFFPKTREKFDKIYAGTKNVGTDIDIIVSQSLDHSRVSSLVRNLNTSLQSKTKMLGLADKGAQYLTYSIILTAALIMSYFSFIDVEEGVNRVLALLVVACPCGLAIAVPLAQTIGVKRAFRNKLLIKNVDVLESVKNVETVVFDKTGTLTLGQIDVLKVLPGPLTSLEKDIVYNLELKSEHPVALALKKFVGQRKLIELESFKEVLGQGVSAFFKGHHYSVESGSLSEGFVVFKKDGVVLHSFELEDKMDEFAKDMVLEFRKRGVETFILSGDKKQRALEIGKAVGVPEENIYFEKTPEEKMSFIENRVKNNLYVGDGVNDALAMSHSKVSVSMSSSADLAFKASKVHILGGGLQSLRALFKISEISIFTMKSIILISLLYNVVFAGFAAFGLISPLIAVIIMPISSVTITLFGFMLMTKKLEGLS